MARRDREMNKKKKRAEKEEKYKEDRKHKEMKIIERKSARQM